MKDIISTFVFVLVQWGLLYFGVIYFSGQSLQELSINSIWKLLFYCISSVGTLMYRLCQRILYSFVNVIPWMRKRVGLVLLLDMVCTWFLVYCVLWIGDIATESLFLHGLVEISLEDMNSKETVLSNAVSIAGILRALHNQEGLGLFRSIWETVVLTVTYSIFYVVQYSVLFGILESKMTEVHVLSKLLGNDDNDDSDVPEYTIFGLLKQIKDCIVDCIDNIAFFSNLKDISALIIFVSICLGYSVGQCLLGNAIEIGALGELLWDNLGLVDVIKSFLLVVVFNFIVQFLLTWLVPILVPSTREFFAHLSIMSSQRRKEMQRLRREWSNTYDVSWGSGPVRPLDLDRLN